MRRAAALACLAGALSACTSFSISKVDPDGNAGAGARFSLPRPYLMVTPKGDGTIDVSVVYLPDPDATFAIDATTYLSSYTLDVETSEGLLTLVSWKQDQTAALGQALETSSTVAQGALQERAKAEAQQKAELAKAQKALADAQDAERVAKAVAEANRTADNQAKLAAARAAKQNALLHLSELANAAGKPEGQAWGPLFYAIDDTVANKQHTVKLTAVPAFDVKDENGAMTSEAQRRFPTSRPPAEAGPGMEFFPKGEAKPLRPKAGAPRQFTISATGPFKRVVWDRIVLKRNKKRLPKDEIESVLTISQVSQLEIRVVVADDAPHGSYELDLPVEFFDGEEHPIPFSFRL